MSHCGHQANDVAAPTITELFGKDPGLVGFVSPSVYDVSC